LHEISIAAVVVPAVPPAPPPHSARSPALPRQHLIRVGLETVAPSGVEPEPRCFWPGVVARPVFEILNASGQTRDGLGGSIEDHSL
jgi:hypothetical protein